METSYKQTNGNNELEGIIYIRPLLIALWKKKWIILLSSVIFGALVFGISKFLIAPKYQTNFSAYVNNRSSTEQTTTLTGSDLQATQSLVNTYAGIITSRSVLEKVAGEINADLTYDQLKALVSTETTATNGIITVYVTMDDPYLAQSCASKIASIASNEVSRIVEGSSMQIIDQPIVPANIYSPNYMKNTFFGFIFGFILSSAIIIVQELLDDRVKEEGELEEHFGIAVVGTIPDLVSAQKYDSSYGGYYNRKQK